MERAVKLSIELLLELISTEVAITKELCNVTGVNEAIFHQRVSGSLFFSIGTGLRDNEEIKLALVCSQGVRVTDLRGNH